MIGMVKLRRMLMREQSIELNTVNG
jgi:hypothetical protein